MIAWLVFAAFAIGACIGSGRFPIWLAGMSIGALVLGVVVLDDYVRRRV